MIDKSKLVAKRHTPDAIENFWNAVHETIEISKTHPKYTKPFDYQTDEQYFWDFIDEIHKVFKKHNVEIVGVNL